MELEAKKEFVWETVGAARLARGHTHVLVLIGNEVYSMRVEDIIDLTAGYVKVIEVKKLKGGRENGKKETVAGG